MRQQSAAVAIGGGDKNNYASAQSNAVAIGSNAVAANDSIAIGKDVNITGTGSIVIGNNVTSSGDNQIVLGTKDDTIYIPGNIVVGKSAYLGADDQNAITAIRTQNNANKSKLLKLSGGPEKVNYKKWFDGSVDFDTSTINYKLWFDGSIDASAKDGSWTYKKWFDGSVDLNGTIGTTGPLVIDSKGNISLYVCNTDSKWHGVTYKEDKEEVIKAIDNYIKEGIYPNKLF